MMKMRQIRGGWQVDDDDDDDDDSNGSVLW